jgi:hypothetical protein
MIGRSFPAHNSFTANVFRLIRHAGNSNRIMYAIVRSSLYWVRARGGIRVRTEAFSLVASIESAVGQPVAAP